MLTVDPFKWPLAESAKSGAITSSVVAVVTGVAMWFEYPNSQLGTKVPIVTGYFLGFVVFGAINSLIAAALRNAAARRLAMQRLAELPTFLSFSLGEAAAAGAVTIPVLWLAALAALSATPYSTGLTFYSIETIYQALLIAPLGAAFMVLVAAMRNYTTNWSFQ